MTGGCGDSWYNILSSTEIFTEGSQLWSQVGPLPMATSYLAGVSVDNNIIMTGAYLVLDEVINYYTVLS